MNAVNRNVEKIDWKDFNNWILTASTILPKKITSENRFFRRFNGKFGITASNTREPEKICRIELFCNCVGDCCDKILYLELEKDKYFIEKELGIKVEWRFEAEGKNSYITHMADLTSCSSMKDKYEFIKAIIERFYVTFYERTRVINDNYMSERL